MTSALHGIGRAVEWITRERWLPEGFPIPPFPPWRRAACVGVFLTGLALMAVAAQHLGPSGRSVPGWFLPAVAGGVMASLMLAQTRKFDRAEVTAFDPLFVLPAVAVVGLELPLLIVIAAIHPLFMFRLMRVPTAIWPGLMNAGLSLISLTTAAFLWEQLAGQPVWIATLGLVAALLPIPLITTVLLRPPGVGILRGLRVALVDEGRDLLYLYPILTVVTAGVLFSPAALLGVFGLLVLVVMTTRVEQNLGVAEYRLGVDPLTQLANRSRMWDELTTRIGAGDTRGEDVYVLMIDVDDFKRLNDTRGHLEGDRALQAVGAALQTSVRQDDLAARYGGEEFCVVLSDTREADALAIAERIRIACAEALQPWGNTVSIGLSKRVPGTTAPQESVDAADRALYQAKRSGKDRVVVEDHASSTLAKEVPT